MFIEYKMPKKKKDRIISRKKPSRVGRPDVVSNHNNQVQMMNYNECSHQAPPTTSKDYHNPFSKIETAVKDEGKSFNFDKIFVRSGTKGDSNDTLPPQKKKKKK